MGIPGYDGYTKCFEQSMLNHAAEMLVISPFLDKNILKQMVSCSPGAKKTLITRHDSVTKEAIKLFNDGVYTPKEVLTDKVEKMWLSTCTRKCISFADTMAIPAITICILVLPMPP